MEFSFEKVPLLFLAIALVTLVLGFAIVLDVSLANAFGRSESGGERRWRQWPFAADPDVTLLFFWAALVLAVVLSLLVAVST